MTTSLMVKKKHQQTLSPQPTETTSKHSTVRNHHHLMRLGFSWQVWDAKKFMPTTARTSCLNESGHVFYATNLPLSIGDGSSRPKVCGLSSACCEIAVFSMKLSNCHNGSTPVQSNGEFT